VNLPKLTESIIRAAATPQSFERGQDYYQSGAVSNTSIQDNLLIGDCEGTQRLITVCKSNWTRPASARQTAPAPTSMAGCKHTVALLLTHVHHPGSSLCARTLPTCWLTWTADDMAALMTRLLRSGPGCTVGRGDCARPNRPRARRGARK
jgi:hypothetical protein